MEGDNSHGGSKSYLTNSSVLNGRGCFTSGAKVFRTENFQNFPAIVRSCESTKRTGTTQNNIMLPKEVLPDFIWLCRSCLLTCSTLYKERFLSWCEGKSQFCKCSFQPITGCLPWQLYVQLNNAPDNKSASVITCMVYVVKTGVFIF